MSLENLEKFIIKAKASGWVGAMPGGKKIESSRLDSFDITFTEGEFFYQDSFVGLLDFCGQEHVCYKNEAVWSMAYFGNVIQPDLFDSTFLKSALATLYRENRFLGEFTYRQGKYEYRDKNEGDFKSFQGKEEIWSEGVKIYELKYFGGLVRK